MDLASKIHVEVLASHYLRAVLPHRTTVIKDPSMDLARPASSTAPPPKKPTGPAAIEFNDKGRLEMKGELALMQSDYLPPLRLQSLLPVLNTMKMYSRTFLSVTNQ